MDLDQFLAALEEIFVVDTKGTLTLETTIDDIGVVDSMAMLEIQAMADEKLGLKLEPTDIATCRSVGDLCKLLKLHPEG